MIHDSAHNSVSEIVTAQKYLVLPTPEPINYTAWKLEVQHGLVD